LNYAPRYITVWILDPQHSVRSRMPRRIPVNQRVIMAIGVKIQRERINRIPMVRILRHEPRDPSVVIAGLQVIQIHLAVEKIAGIRVVIGNARDGLRFVAKRVVIVFRQRRAALAKDLCKNNI